MAIRGQNIGFSTFDRQGPPYRLVDLELVKQDLLFALKTRRGERVMRPDFGSIIPDLLFEPFDDDTKQAVIDDVAKIIAEDPRVELVSVDVHDLEHTLRVDVSINYTPLDIVETLSIEYDRRNTEAA